MEIDPKDLKIVRTTVPGYEHIEVDVCPVVVFGKTGTAGHSVGVMDSRRGQGMRYSMAYAEAEATALLKAIRSYKRRNAKVLAQEAETDD